MRRLIHLIPLALLAACTRQEEPELRRYREISIPAPTRTERRADVAAMSQVPPATAPAASAMNAPGAPAVASTPTELAWTTPDGWTEHRNNPMRIVTFLVGPEQAECAVTAFPGAVGGIEGNLQRWAGQINLSLAPDALARFARGPETFKTQGEFSCLLYDFGAAAPEIDPSMLAAILPLDDRTIFVKFTGPRALLARQKAAFRALCESLRP